MALQRKKSREDFSHHTAVAAAEERGEEVLTITTSKALHIKSIFVVVTIIDNIAHTSTVGVTAAVAITDCRPWCGAAEPRSYKSAVLK